MNRDRTKVLQKFEETAILEVVLRFIRGFNELYLLDHFFTPLIKMSFKRKVWKAFDQILVQQFQFKEHNCDRL